ncbi:hypothetical protein KDL01_21525 [Actinospica durhamensis]|uniref:ATP-binding protein n=1 Tax=Actinospica durhamensis TaxID=1508375 RepID=A0A941EVN9_9ACTN|nr:hypothetical protein [Actinospica durhamensis]MBR7835869.1 hypothetical protein [Actinospica durhamensis]
MTGKHRRPRTTGRTIAATAAVLTAGAIPLAAAGSAFASTAAGDPLAATGLSALPMAGAMGSQLTESAGLGAMPVAGAGLTQKTNELYQKADELTEKADQLTAQLGTGAPVRDLLHEMVPPNPHAVPGEIAPGVLRNGAVGTMTGGVGQRTSQVAADVAGQVQPTAKQLHSSGVPTVGDVTSSLSRTQMPMFGTVGSLTSAVPVGAVLGDPVMNALGAASQM